MRLQRWNNGEATGPRRGFIFAGIGLIVLGLILGGFRFAARDALAASAEDKAEPAKKASPADAEDEVRKALEALKKGADPKKDDKEVDRNPIDEQRRAEEALKKAQKELRENPTSPEARKAFDEAVKKNQEAMKNRGPRINAPGFAPFPLINPGDLQDVERMNQEMQRMMQQMQLQIGGRRGMIGPGQMNPFQMGEFRLGVRIEKPTPVLVEQLDLPTDKGMVVTGVMPETPASKAGIKANDILLEIGGKAVPNDSFELQNLLRTFKSDEKVAIVLMRKGKKETLKDVALPESQPNPFNPLRPNPLPLPAPRLQVPNIQPVPVIPAVPPEFFGGNNTQMSIQVDNDDFTISYATDAIKIKVVGVKKGGKKTVSSVEIEADGKKTKSDSVEKVDADHRPMVQMLLNRVR